MEEEKEEKKFGEGGGLEEERKETKEKEEKEGETGHKEEEEGKEEKEKNREEKNREKKKAEEKKNDKGKEKKGKALSLDKVFYTLFACLFFAILSIFSFINQKNISVELASVRDEKEMLEKKLVKIERLVSLKEEKSQSLRTKDDFFKENGKNKTEVTLMEEKNVLGGFVVDGLQRSGILKKGNKNIYVGLFPEERGAVGYETFSDLYRFNPQTGEAVKIRIAKTISKEDESYIYFDDVSSDEGKLAYVFGSEIVIEDLYTGEILKIINTDEKFLHIGAACFSPSGKRLAFGGTTSYKQGENEEAAVFLLNLEEEDEIQVAEKNNGGFFHIDDWLEDESSVQVSLSEF